MYLFTVQWSEWPELVSKINVAAGLYLKGEQERLLKIALLNGFIAK